MVKAVEEKIGCPNFISHIWKQLRLMKKSSEGQLMKLKLGTPQGSVLSPILPNLVLHKLDLFMEQIKSNFDIGKYRQANPKYTRILGLRKRAKASYNAVLAKQLLNELIKEPKHSPKDHEFKRLNYLRYGDDFIVLVIGSLKDCEMIRERLRVFLNTNCGLDLSLEKTEITRTVKGFTFLGVECRKLKRNSTFLVTRAKTGQRAVGTPRLLMNAPINKILEKFLEAGIIRKRNGKLIP